MGYGARAVKLNPKLEEFAQSLSSAVPRLLEDYGLYWASNDDGNIITKPGQLDYYEWYYAYGRLFLPRRILEIGVYGGASVLFACLGAADGQRQPELVQLLDNEQYRRSTKEAASRIAQVASGCRFVTLAHDSLALTELPVPEGGSFDFISIDGDHRSAACYHDMRISLPHMTPDGHILVDDGRATMVEVAVKDFVSDRPFLYETFVEGTFTGTRILHRKDNGHPERCPLLVP